jgi:hypothetical protein
MNDFDTAPIVEPGSYEFRFRVAGVHVTCSVVDSTLESWLRTPLGALGMEGVKRHALMIVVAHLRKAQRRAEQCRVVIRDGRVQCSLRAVG